MANVARTRILASQLGFLERVAIWLPTRGQVHMNAKSHFSNFIVAY